LAATVGHQESGAEMRMRLIAVVLFLSVSRFSYRENHMFFVGSASQFYKHKPASHIPITKSQLLAAAKHWPPTAQLLTIFEYLLRCSETILGNGWYLVHFCFILYAS